MVEIKHILVEIKHIFVEIDPILVEIDHILIEIEHILLQIEHIYVETEHISVEIEHIFVTDGTMTTKSKRPLSRDLLNLALILAFLHVDPEAYLGLQSPRYMPASTERIYSNKILDDLSALGHGYNGHINPGQVEISAYILNSAETFPQPPQQQNFSAVINNYNENNINMDYDDSGVSDVDSNFSGSGASPRAHDNLEQDAEVKLEDSNDYSAMFDTNESSNIFRDLDDILESELKVESDDYAPDEEDVENQLMHIDDQLIRLDENIEDISGHLDIFDSTK